ncbi:MAG: hypothetical protein IEMM0002_0008 [bacterium]|nr:MAG: hypothetical protein IEMM0002_0008 [bacterium]
MLWKYLESPVRRSCVVAEITKRNVRVIGLTKNNGGVIVDGFGEAAIAAAVVVQNSPSLETAEAIKKICGQNRLRSKTLISLTPGDEVFIRRVEMPKMDKKELVSSLRFSERDALPYPVESAYIDAWLLDDAPGDRGRRIKGRHPPPERFDCPGDRGRRIKVLMAAMEYSDIKRLNEIFDAARLRHTAISAVPAALAAVIAESKTMDKSLPVPVVYVGGSVTGVYVFHEDSIVFSRVINIGSDGFNHEAATGYSTPEETFNPNILAAEILDKPYGAPKKAAPQPAWPEPARSQLDKIAAEVGRSIEYFMEENRVDDLPPIRLVGSVAFLPYVAKRLENTLKYEFRIYNPFDDFVTAPKYDIKSLREKGPELTVLIGAALDRGRRLNLLPVQSRHSFKTVIRRIIPFAAAAGYLLFLLLLHNAGSRYLKNLESRIADMENVTSNIQTEKTAGFLIENETAKLASRISTVKARMKIYPELNGNSIDWKDLHKEIGDLLPSGIALEEIQISFRNPQEREADGNAYSGQIVLRGKVRGSPNRQLRGLRSFLEKMRASPWFERASLLSSIRKDRPGNKMGTLLFFTMTADLKGR